MALTWRKHEEMDIFGEIMTDLDTWGKNMMELC